MLRNVETHFLPEIERPLFQLARGKTVLLPSERKEIAVTPAQQQEVVGTYALPDGTRFWVRAEGKGLSTRVGAQPWVPIFAESKDHFYARLVDAQWEVVRGAGDAVDDIPAAGAYRFALDTTDPRAPQLTITKAQ